MFAYISIVGSHPLREKKLSLPLPIRLKNIMKPLPDSRHAHPRYDISTDSQEGRNYVSAKRNNPG